ncbi:nuclear transport factor 2 family protein [Kribbella sp. NPDC005582]|uniref:nuclear transport factor 2 family protein n=1 Tax=Kribbella sp. NPDC005582 TaxID=3156893 RepID=UPI0033BBFD8D
MTELQAMIESLGRSWTGDPAAIDDLLAEDVVIETPFAAGGPARWDGREEWLAFAVPARSEFPVRFDRFTPLVVHETTDPEVAVLEYELAGAHPVTGERAAAQFVGVLRVRDGKIAGWREYQNTYAIVQALGRR